MNRRAPKVNFPKSNCHYKTYPLSTDRSGKLCKKPDDSVGNSQRIRSPLVGQVTKNPHQLQDHAGGEYAVLLVGKSRCQCECLLRDLRGRGGELIAEGGEFTDEFPDQLD